MADTKIIDLKQAHSLTLILHAYFIRTERGKEEHPPLLGSLLLLENFLFFPYYHTSNQTLGHFSHDVGR